MRHLISRLAEIPHTACNQRTTMISSAYRPIPFALCAGCPSSAFCACLCLYLYLYLCLHHSALSKLRLGMRHNTSSFSTPMILAGFSESIGIHIHMHSSVSPHTFVRADTDILDVLDSQLFLISPQVLGKCPLRHRLLQIVGAPF